MINLLFIKYHIIIYEESLLKTIKSLSILRYDDKRKLLFIISYGMIVGSGNDCPTPRIILDLLGVAPSVDPEAFSFQSIGEGIINNFIIIIIIIIIILTFIIY